MFIAALFIIAKLWKQTRCPTLINGFRKCDRYTHTHTHTHTRTMEFYSAISNNDNMCFEDKWMQLEDIMLSEVS
jgi:hypothetical protein